MSQKPIPKAYAETSLYVQGDCIKHTHSYKFRVVDHMIIQVERDGLPLCQMVINPTDCETNACKARDQEIQSEELADQFQHYLKAQGQ